MCLNPQKIVKRSVFLGRPIELSLSHQKVFHRHCVIFLNERRPYLIQFDQHVLLLCFGCGYFLDVNLFDVDHVQSSKMILDRQKGMIKKMNQDPAFAEQVLALPGAKNYIHVVPTEPHSTYRGTKLFYRSYHNALHNLWLLCKKCNGGSDKHDGDFMDWFRQSKFLGLILFLQVSHLIMREL